ncbi:MAG: signal peptidase I [Oscillospiraceae bacterium]|nr:signal peptidase I [Oscillospiraceae bacterium]
MEEEIILETEEKKKELTPEEIKEQKKKKLKAEIIDWAKTIFFYCLIPLAVFQTFCFMASVPTGSMETTIPVGAQVLTTRSFDKDNIERGDIVVFESEELGVVLIKRCIGLPGETVTFDGTGDVYINGGKLYEGYVSSFSSFEGEFVVPEDCYFFLGDNRGGSLDARYWENPYIHKDYIKGKARFILFPFSCMGSLE